MEKSINETVADKALALGESTKSGTVNQKVYKPGMYRADKFMRVIKELTHTHQRDDSGKIQKTYGTWVNDKNMIIFQKGVERPLSKEDLKLASIQRLIDSKVIFRVGE